MIRNEEDLIGTRKRIRFLLDLLGQLRVTATPEESPFVAGGYRAEVERMQQEELDYLTRHASETTAKAG
jgi:hypothetical protein